MSTDAASRSDTDVWCVIPVYNNAATIADVARRCRERVANVLVVDDGSTDADLTALLRGTGIQVLRHRTNRGKGQALLTGLEHVALAGGRFMITLDGDAQHFPEDLDRFLPLLDENTILVGARREVDGDMPRRSRFGRAFSDLWITIETGHRVEDTQSGFRAYPVRHLSRLRLHCRHYDFEVEVLTRALWAGLQVVNVPIRVWYAPAGQRLSHFRPFLDNLRISLVHTRLVGRRLVPWPRRRLVRRDRDLACLFANPRAFIVRLLCENASPGGLALAAAVGVFLGALPLIGCHMIVILYVATRLNLNKVMALAIQNLCMPPFVPLVCIAVGYFARHGRVITNETLAGLARQPLDRLLEWFLGSLLVGPMLAVLCGAAVYGIAKVVGRTLPAGRAGDRKAAGNGTGTGTR